MFEELDILKSRLPSKKVLSPEEISKLREVQHVLLTYHSLTIEGGLLSLEKIKSLLKKEFKKNLKKDNLEAINYNAALSYIEGRIFRTPTSFNERLLLNIHYILFRGIDDINAGKYRSRNLKFSNLGFESPDYRTIPKLLKDFFDWLKTPSKGHPGKFAADAYLNLFSICPFDKGNRLVAQLMMNLFLIHNSYPMALIKKEDREEYFKSLKEAQDGSRESFYRLIINSIKNNFYVIGTDKI